MSFSDYLENKLLDHLFGKASYTAPTIYVGLSTADPLDDASGLAEPSSGGYARVATAPADWNAALNGLIDNANAVTFPQATGDWSGGANQTHFALFDAASAGNMLAHGALGTAKPVLSGDTPSFAAGDLDTSLD